jgi:hypothetical protein
MSPPDSPDRSTWTDKEDLSELLGHSRPMTPTASRTAEPAPAMRGQSLEESVEYEISRLFTCHPPGPDQIPRYNDVRLAARMLATVIYRTCPSTADRSAAIRHLRECVMTANAAIALS